MVKLAKVLAVVVVGAALAAGALLVRGRGATSAPGPSSPAAARAAAPSGAPARPAIPVQVAAVVERPVLEAVSFVAAVEPSVATTVGAEVDGRVVAMPVREGDRVVAGQAVLARIDAGPRGIQLREAAAAVAHAREERDKLRRGYRPEEIEQRAAEMSERRAIMDRAEPDFARARRLHAAELISKAELHRFGADYLAAKEAHQRTDAAHRMMRAGPRVEEIAQAAGPESTSLPAMRALLGKLRQASQGVPGTVAVFATQSPLFRRRGAFFGGTNLQVDVKGRELETIRQTAEGLEARLKQFPGANFVNSSFEWGNPELRVTVDRERAAALGLSAREVGYIVETAVGGTLAGTFKEGGKEIDIKLVSTARDGRRTQDVHRTVFYTRAGVPLRLAEIAEVAGAAGPTKVQHVDQDRAIAIRPGWPCRSATRSTRSTSPATPATSSRPSTPSSGRTSWPRSSSTS
jgi:multidrug efflux pump subunit AcrA (membrane-fusion protein)